MAEPVAAATAIAGSTPSRVAAAKLVDRIGIRALPAVTRKWGAKRPTSPSSAPSGATKARARSSTGCRPRRRRRALPGRPQCRPHARRRRPDLQAVAAARRASCAARSVIGNGVVLDPWALLARSSGSRQGVKVTPDNLMHRRDLPADPALPPRSRRACARMRAAPARSAPRGAASARPMRTRSAAARSACATSRISTTLEPIDRSAAHHNALRARLRRAADRPRAGAARSAAGDRRRVLPFAAPSGNARRGAAPRQAHPVRGRAGRAARRRPRHLPVRHLVEHRRGHSRGRARASGPSAASAMCSASSRPTRRASARALPDRAVRRDRQAARRARAEFGTVTGRPRRCGWFDAVLVRQAVAGRRRHRHRADQARRARRLRAAVCTGYSVNGDGSSTDLPAHRRRSGAAEPVYEDDEGWSGSTAGARSWAELPAGRSSMSAASRN
jgi:adenylosuccinate synthase